MQLVEVGDFGSAVTARHVEMIQGGLIEDAGNRAFLFYLLKQGQRKAVGVKKSGQTARTDMQGYGLEIRGKDGGMSADGLAMGTGQAHGSDV